MFTSAYSLRPLRLVESYIRQHGHLPGVPSAGEVVRQGVEVASMEAKLLEKVEELTLYSIQLEKANQKQQEELRLLKQKQAQIEQLLQEVLK